MAERSRRLQVRATLGNCLAALAVVALLLAVFGGYATYGAYAAPGTTETQRTVEAWAVSGGFEQNATVTESNPVFPVGTQLENRSTYFVGVSPIMHGAFTLRQRPPADTPVSVTLDSRLRTRSVGEEDGTVYWQTTRPLDAATVERLGGDDTARVSFRVNTSRVLAHRDRITSQLGSGPGTLETAVVVDATVSGPVEGAPTTLAFTKTLPLSFSGSTYTVGSHDSVRQAATRTRTVSVPRTYGPLQRIGGPLAFFVGVIALAALVGTKRSGILELDDDERERLSFERDRSEFDDWIVRARLPTAVQNRDLAFADTLADVVDFAIDADTGVVENIDDGRFYALSDDLTLVYEPPRPSEVTADVADAEHGSDETDSDDSPAESEAT
ncbi:DUF5305 domain-containing protein [Halarchaeum nitratireducens]|uniref:DUF5305 domain-containing protein n=1 Tax=Halarchaeum nitratireducens TaxID=489913 RepID=A0A830GE58_9EURY|nr:DUF5305 domain-containing protein [Halarchaeum nitratireducens]GGN22737.1 hypothetical protein GCM10009021_25400 [Halarchaeum nitratireducens]